jgi:hypothetical protein
MSPINSYLDRDHIRRAGGHWIGQDVGRWGRSGDGAAFFVRAEQA